MKKIFLLAFSFILFFACTESGRHYKKEYYPHKIDVESLPKWTSQFPDNGNYVIGIAQKSFNPEDTEDAARQMASVMKCRNKGSYTIDKYASTESDFNLKDGVRRFKLNVCADPEDMKNLYENLKLIDQAELYGYFIGLYSLEGVEIAENYRQRIIGRFPDWFEDEKLIDTGDEIYVYQTESSSDLAVAWERAAENARQELAKYLEKDVLGAVTRTDEEIEKMINIESTKKLINMEITRSYIQSELEDALYSFKVYIEMKMIR